MGRAGASPHHRATKARPPHWLGKGQNWGHGTYCHCLHPVLLGSSFVADSTSCTSLRRLGSPACHCSPARAAGPGVALAPSMAAQPGLLQQGLSPGQSAATEGSSPPIFLGLVLGGPASMGLRVCAHLCPRREARGPCKALAQDAQCRLLTPASSWLIS